MHECRDCGHEFQTAKAVKQARRNGCRACGCMYVDLKANATRGKSRVPSVCGVFLSIPEDAIWDHTMREFHDRI